MCCWFHRGDGRILPLLFKIRGSGQSPVTGRDVSRAQRSAVASQRRKYFRSSQTCFSFFKQSFLGDSPQRENSTSLRSRSPSILRILSAPPLSSGSQLLVTEVSKPAGTPPWVSQNHRGGL